MKKTKIFIAAFLLFGCACFAQVSKQDEKKAFATPVIVIM